MQTLERQAQANFETPENLSAFLPGFLEKRKPSALFVLTDRNTRKHCLPFLKEYLPKTCTLIQIPAGEIHKNLETCKTVWETLTRKNADRKALLLNLGGGVVGDLGGFCASAYKRGIAFIQVPTSLLAMVDASLGGKTGIDFEGYKNQIGAFAMPETVWIYPPFLDSLPETELLSGFAEVIKHALIADSSAWHLLRKRELRQQNWKELIPASLKVKQAIVEADPFEKGERKKLNAGHTLGHALESHLMNLGKPMPHGHCVAAGLVMEGRIAVEKGLLSDAELVQIEELIYAQFGAIEFSKKDIPAILRLCRQDKKNEGGQVLLSLVGPIGNCTIDVGATEAELKMGLRYYLG
jgi:3-dehydroquinate synthase